MSLEKIMLSLDNAMDQDNLRLYSTILAQAKRMFPNQSEIDEYINETFDLMVHSLDGLNEEDVNSVASSLLKINPDDHLLLDKLRNNPKVNLLYSRTDYFIDELIITLNEDEIVAKDERLSTAIFEALELRPDNFDLINASIKYFHNKDERSNMNFAIDFLISYCKTNKGYDESFIKGISREVLKELDSDNLKAFEEIFSVSSYDRLEKYNPTKLFSLKELDDAFDMQNFEKYKGIISSLVVDNPDLEFNSNILNFEKKRVAFSIFERKIDYEQLDQLRIWLNTEIRKNEADQNIFGEFLPENPRDYLNAMIEMSDKRHYERTLKYFEEFYDKFLTGVYIPLLQKERDDVVSEILDLAYDSYLNLDLNINYFYSLVERIEQEIGQIIGLDNFEPNNKPLLFYQIK